MGVGHWSDDAVCGACSGRVADGGCRVCRSLRGSPLEQRGIDWRTFLLAIVAAVVALLCLLTYYVRLA
ncbi:MAG: hypothetical protein ACR2FF_01595 [Mycobacteriales bacterium]|nr:MAG: hypothetical protein DLM56_03855 [Pseudonocardiales bacterium]